MALADYDRDGNVDLLVIQNDFAPVPTIGRFDGGLGALFRGEGRGGFSFLEGERSGVIIPGNARDVVATDVDLDGEVDWIVTRGNATTLLLTK
ncbi:MAG: hypothetical protein J6386_18090 [Candidatus Synoicihabitans palmerolidicus]|nr:hypothetical protein [Candidatus Synoicihabitans palmerolidicus]